MAFAFRGLATITLCTGIYSGNHRLWVSGGSSVLPDPVAAVDALCACAVCAAGDVSARVWVSSRNWKIMKDSYEKVTNKYLPYIKKDKLLYKKYKLKLLHFKYEILISEAKSSDEIERLKIEWKKEKYKTKHSNPIILFFKLLISKK